MKRSLLLLALLLILLIGTTMISNAQQITGKTYIEQTHLSPKFGTSVGYVFSGAMELGGFYQQSTQSVTPEPGRPLNVENEFYGAYFAYPVLIRNHVNLKLNVRTGVSNGQNFVITPSFMANYQPIKVLGIGAGIGTRALRPTLMASISLKLNSQSKGARYLASN